MALFVAIKHWKRKSVQDEFEQKSNVYVSVFQGGIARSIGLLRSLAAFNNARCSVDERGFKDFTREYKEFSSCSLSCHKEVRMLAWAPYVYDSERNEFEGSAQIDGFPEFQIKQIAPDGTYSRAVQQAEYFPIYNVEPFEENKELFGLDLSSNEALKQARDSGEITATERLFIKINGKERVAYMLFLPLYAVENHYETKEERHEHIRGVVAGQFLIDEIITAAIAKMDLKDIEIHFYDESEANEEKRLLFVSDGIRKTGLSGQNVDADLYATKFINIGGRKWRILFHSTPKYLADQMEWQARGFLAMGLFLTTLIVTYFLFSASKTSYIERLVAERTAELANTNEKLGVEIVNHKRTEDALRQSEENYKNIFDNTQVGLFQIGIADSKVINANLKFAHIFGYENQNDIIQQFVLQKTFINPEAYQKLIAELKEKGEVKNMEAHLLRRDNSVVWVRFWARIYSHKNYIEGVATNITEEKQVEEENKKLQSQLLQAQKLESIGRLAGGIAHDFNNMLTGIIGYSELAMSEVPENTSTWKKLQIIENSGKKAALLTHQLLAFSRKQILDMRTINLNAVVENMNALLVRIIGDDVVLKINTKLKIRNIKADPTQIEQVIMNLSVNARDAMPNGGYLTIETADVQLKDEYFCGQEKVKPGNYVLMSVTDGGIGMTADVMDKIFEPFFTTKKRGKGTGLGLSTVFGIVKQHSGYICVKSEIGSGSTFNIYFPAVEEEEEKVATEVSKTMQMGSETVLVVDDEPFVLQFVTDTLIALGYNVLSATNSEGAMRICHNYNGVIDVLLTDLILQGINGKELADAVTIKKPGIKALFMSGHTDGIIVEDGVLDSNVNFIKKPFTPAELSKELRAVLDKK